MGEANNPKPDTSFTRSSSPSAGGVPRRVLAATPPVASGSRIQARVINNRSQVSNTRVLSRNLPTSALQDNELKRRSIQDANAILAGGSQLPVKPNTKPWQQSWLMPREERSMSIRPKPIGSVPLRSTIGQRHSPNPSLELTSSLWVLTDPRLNESFESPEPSTSRKPAVKFSLDGISRPLFSGARTHGELVMDTPVSSRVEPDIFTVEDASRRPGTTISKATSSFSVSGLLASHAGSESQVSTSRVDLSTATVKGSPSPNKQPSVLDRGRRKSPRSPSPSARLSRTPSQSTISPQRSDSFLLSPIRYLSPESQTTCDPGDLPPIEDEEHLLYSAAPKLASLAAKPQSWFSRSFSPQEQQLLMDICRSKFRTPMADRGVVEEKQLIRVSVRLKGSFATSPTSETSSAVSHRTTPVSSPTSHDCVLSMDAPYTAPNCNHVLYRNLRMPSSLAPGESEYFLMSFKEVLGPDAQQSDVFETVARPYLEETLSRFRHGVIMAYGQTGTGKTYTLEGTLPTNDSVRRGQSAHRALGSAQRNLPTLPEEAGIIPRTLWWLFNEPISSQMKETFHPYFPKMPERATLEQFLDIKMSVLEIYMEQPRDLLTGSDKVKLRETPGGDLFWESLSEEVVTSYERSMSCFSRARQYRRIGETMVNRKSSRSHVILTLILKVKALPLKCRLDVPIMRIHLLDLAGNEKLSKSQVTGTGLQELKKINHSLSTLALVMQTLSKYYTPKLPKSSLGRDATLDRSGEARHHPQRSTVVRLNPHVPYRNSLLTRALQQSLSGDNPVVLICTVSNHRKDYLESLATLRFAQQCQNIALMAKHSSGNSPTDPTADGILKQCITKLVLTILRMEKSNSSHKRKTKNCKPHQRHTEADAS